VGRALESALVFAALLLLVAGRHVGDVSRQAARAGRQELLHIPLRYAEEWLRFTNTLAVARRLSLVRLCQALGPGGEPGGALC